MQFNIYVIPLSVSVLVSTILGLYAYRHRRAPASTEMMYLLFALALWSLGSALEGVVTTREMKIYWSVIQYIVAQSTPVLFLLVVLRFTRKDWWVTPRRLALLFVIPFVAVAMAATNHWHKLLWREIELEKTWAGIVGIFHHGPWYWVQSVYAYSLLAAGVVLLIRAVFSGPKTYSKQALLVLVAALLPWIWNFMYGLSPETFGGMDITPVWFTISGIFLIFAVFRYQLLEVVPIARNVLFENIPDAMIVIDSRGSVVDMNPAAEALAGLSLKKVVGQNLDEVFASYPSIIEFARGSPLPDGTQVELQIGREYKVYEARMRSVPSKRGPLGYLLTFHDITEHKFALEELKRINAELDMYAHTVSHDLKSPLTAVSLANETIVKILKSPVTSETTENIEKLSSVMNDNVKRAFSLIDGILELAQAGQKPRDVDIVEISEIIKKIQEEKSEEIERRNIRIETDELDTITANKTQIYQLFSNIISNAIKHNDSSDPLIEIRLLESGEGFHRYLIRDNGSGMPEEDLEKIFTPFYKRGKTGETGIGLATALRISRVYGGNIRAYNKNGACFEISLYDYGAG